MRKPQLHEEGKTETKFLLSFIFLLVALGITFVVMYIYAPRHETDLAIEKPTVPSKKLGDLPHTKTRHLEPEAPTSAEAKSETPTPGKTPDKARVDALLQEVIALVDNNKPLEARKILENILKEDPSNEQALTELAMIHLIDLKEPAAAMGYLEQAMRINPDNKVVLSELVGLYDEVGQGEGGLAFLQDLYEKNPNSATLATGIGQMLAAQDRPQEAIPYLEKVVEQGGSETNMTELADVYADAGQHDKALQTYRKRVEMEEGAAANGVYDNQPGQAEERVAMARVDVINELINQKRYREAEDEYARVREAIKEEEFLRPLLEQIQLAKKNNP